jgi:hypothetical protein
MAEIRRIWMTPLAAAVLLSSAGIFVCAQSTHSGALSGKLTDLNSTPLANATVVVRNRATGAETRTVTARDGGYRFESLEAGQYSLEADSPKLGRGTLDDIRVSAGHLARVQAAMQFELAPPVAARAMFVRDPAAKPAVNAIPPQKLVAASPAAQPLPLTQRQPLKTETPVLAASIGPIAPPVASLAALPANELPHLAAAISAVPAASIFPGMASCIAAANGLRTAMQGGLQRLTPVQYAARQIDLASATMTATLSSAELQSLPLNGQRWEEFVADTSASASALGSLHESSSSAGGQVPETSVDGVSTQLAFGDGSTSAAGSRGQSSSSPEVSEPQGMGQAWSVGRLAVSESAVSSVRTVTGVIDARSGAGHMDAETHRGGNALHGQAFLFDRQNNWGARNPLTQWVRETAPATTTTVPEFTAQSFTAPDHEFLWGAGAGSRIRRGKLFWFGSLEALARNDPAVSSVKHPDKFFAQPANDQMQLLGAQLGTSTSGALASYSKMLETLDGLLGPAQRTSRRWSGLARIDWQAAERHRFTFEVAGANGNSPGGGLTRVSETYGNHSLGSSHASEQRLMARWEAYLTPNLMAVSQGSVGRAIRNAHAHTPSTFEQTLNQNVWGQLPQIVVDSRYGFTIGNPSRFGRGSYPDERVVQVQQSVDWVHGSLLVKAGLNLSHNADATGLLRNQTGTYYYSSVENFVADTLIFSTYGFTDALDKFHQHGCDPTGKAWRDSSGQLRGLGYLPCYSHYTQMMGPTDWHLSTNDWAGFASAQWQPNHLAVMSIGVRWQQQQLPPPIASLTNPDLPLTSKLPSPGFNWAPRLSFTIGQSETHWPILRLGYGMYYGRTPNATLGNVLTQTGSLKGDMNFFVRPSDNLRSGGAPPFPYVFAGEPASVIKPAASEFAPNYRNPQVHQAMATLDESLPGHVLVSASAVVSLGRRLPIAIDSNMSTPTATQTITYAVVDGTGKGPIKASQIKVPFYASWPSSTSATGTTGRLNSSYQQVAEIFSRANSTYEALLVKISHSGRRGLNFRTQYTYGRAMDWNPNGSSSVAGNDVLDPLDFSREYGTSNLDVRHTVAATLVFTSPWKLHSLAGEIANGWTISSVGHFRSGLPYTMRTGGSLPKQFNVFTGDVIAALGPGMNGSSGDNRVYGVGSDNVVYNIGRNTFRYPATWKADMRISRQINFGAQRHLLLLAESYNLFNHQNVTQLETTGYSISPGTLTGTLPTLNFLTGLKANSTAFGQPLSSNATNYYRERQIQFGMRMTF